MFRKLVPVRGLTMSLAFAAVVVLGSSVFGTPVPPPKCDNIFIMRSEAFLNKTTGQCVMYDDLTCERCDGTIFTVCEPVGTEVPGQKCGKAAIVIPIKQFPILPDKTGVRCGTYCVPKFGETWKQAVRYGEKDVAKGVFVGQRICITPPSP
jgi:hypothetical protein